jgi:glutathione S-transferase
MPIIEAKDTTLKNLKGLHLWHGNLSSCSQRVRITLEEKGLKWTGHLVDIPNNEHATEKYQKINPKGLVPALVDNGTLLIESCDIIDYLDKEYPKTPLRPVNPVFEPLLLEWLDKANKAQADLKLLSHEFLFRPRKPMNDYQIENFAASHNNPDLVAFIREWQGNDVFPKEKIDDAVTRTDADFNLLNNTLADREWILGDNFTLADISWMPNIHRMTLMDWPLERYQHLEKWFNRVKMRQSYHNGLIAWEPKGLQNRFLNYVKQRKIDSGIHVTCFGALASGI